MVHPLFGGGLIKRKGVRRPPLFTDYLESEAQNCCRCSSRSVYTTVYIYMTAASQVNKSNSIDEGAHMNAEKSVGAGEQAQQCGLGTTSATATAVHCCLSENVSFDVCTFFRFCCTDFDAWGACCLYCCTAVAYSSSSSRGLQLDRSIGEWYLTTRRSRVDFSDEPEKTCIYCTVPRCLVSFFVIVPQMLHFVPLVYSSPLMLYTTYIRSIHQAKKKLFGGRLV